tara:strand:- start:716 stop:886 length:171 start_codon:yes stop_codon:yes gene_type:complete
MKIQQQKNLFGGANEQQLLKIKKQAKIEKTYMAFVKSNPNLAIKEYKTKYKSLNSN